MPSRQVQINIMERRQYYRALTLLSLLLMNGLDSVLRRYSQGILKEMYSVNEVLLVAELIKMTFSAYMIYRFRDDDGDADQGKAAKQGERTLPAELSQLLLSTSSRRMLLLVILYGFGNRLSYYALRRIPASTFVVIANLKTLTTAGFSVFMLGRSYSWGRWRALLLLVCGVVLFVLPTLEGSHDRGSDGDDGNGSDDDGTTSAEGRMRGDVLAGCAAELAVVTISGFAAIYFEVAIKQHGTGDGNADGSSTGTTNIWGRNFQLGFYSVIMYLLFRGLEETATTHDDDAAEGEGRRGGVFFRPFFVNWSFLAVILSCSAACGGLLVALSIKYGDSVLKTLAVSGSILFASVVDHYLLGGPLTGQMGVAAVVTVIAIVNYAFDDSSTKTATVTSSDDNRGDERGADKGGEEWDENETIEMRPLVDAGSEVANRRSHISA